MAIDAKIKFVQGATIGTPGVSLIGVLSTPVDVSNGNDTGVVRWIWKIVDSPPGSAVPVGLISDGPIATFQFAPDLRGGYEVELTVFDSSGAQKIDHRVFQIRELSNRLIPPFSADAPALNFLSQTRGWAPYMEDYLHFMDLFSTPDGSVPLAARTFQQDVTGARVVYDAKSLQTANATPTEIYRWTIPAGANVKIDYIVNASGTLAANSATFAKSISYRRAAAAAPAVTGSATPDDLGSRPAVPFVSAPAFSIAGNDVVLTGTGIAGPVRWAVFFQVTIGFDPT
jgi:hypothetical protein